MAKHLICCWIRALVALFYFEQALSFNLDISKPTVFAGPPGSYFGFSVAFFNPDNKQLNILVGAPRANTSDQTPSTVTERGAVFNCPWHKSGSCTQIEFDSTDDRKNSNGQQMEFKSNQWFGATVRSSGDHILACAPLYQWSTYGLSEREPVGTCYLKKGNNIVEYSPCRSNSNSPEGQGFCQAGFSADFVKLISDDITEVISRYNKEFFTPYGNQLSTKSAGAQYDDSYLGRGSSLMFTWIHGAKLLLLVKLSVMRTRPSGCSVSSSEGQLSVSHRHCLIFSPSSRLSRGWRRDLPADTETPDTRPLKRLRLMDGCQERPQLFRLRSSSLLGLKMDLLVGAPLFMDRGSDGKLREVGQVYVYLGKGGFTFNNVIKLSGSEIYARYGSSICSLGDLNMDGYNDVAIAAPYGGQFHRGLVYIHNGRPTGPNPVASESFTVKYCLKANGKGAPPSLHFQVYLTLDRLKHKGAIKRVLFLHNKMSHYSKNMTVSNSQGPACEELQAYLIDDSEFRDKITPISVFMEYSLNYKAAADKTGLLPILDQSTPTNVTKQAHILLDCGEDNICKPDLKLSVVSDQKEIYIGDDNPLTLEVTAENGGEGAYEADLTVTLPSQADFIGVVRNSETLSRLSCAFKKENQTRVVVCDLGNPMKGGTKIIAGLRFSVHQLSEQDTEVKFDLQIQSSNQFNNTSNLVSVVTKLAVLAKVKLRGVSAPEQVFLPIANWQPKENPVLEDDIGPLVQHIYELRNTGPSTFSKAILDVQWPYRFNNGSLLYITKFEVDGNMNCSSNRELNPLNVTNPRFIDKNETSASGDRAEGRNRHRVHRRDLEDKQGEENLEILDCGNAECQEIKCWVGRLEKGQSAILFIYSRLAVSTFLKAESQNKSYNVRSSASFSVIEMPYKNLYSELPASTTSASLKVIWNSENPQPVPGWVVALAVLAGLLLLALLIFVMYKLGFFKRVRPPQDDSIEKEQLQPQENGDRNTEA
ncbi:integrin alpha-V-like [Sinocyclocheilus grahami]|uniref:integrin alpha-V-like n=1 Tax=Sinocyclocheilus grahami TaxID=75366 RepID=UPI0007AC9582|nr:PREDICTED: integrin alpha-V-like [Sinocyclocheilus grahami]